MVVLRAVVGFALGGLRAFRLGLCCLAVVCVCY